LEGCEFSVDNKLVDASIRTILHDMLGADTRSAERITFHVDKPTLSLLIEFMQEIHNILDEQGSIVFKEDILRKINKGLVKKLHESKNEEELCNAMSEILSTYHSSKIRNMPLGEFVENITHYLKNRRNENIGSQLLCLIFLISASVLSIPKRVYCLEKGECGTFLTQVIFSLVFFAFIIKLGLEVRSDKSAIKFWKGLKNE
jgi:hypothetical protein